MKQRYRHSIYRIGLAIIAALTLLYSTIASAQKIDPKRFSDPVITPGSPPSFDDFKPALQIVLNRMVESYSKGESNPLQVVVLDKEVPSIKNFIEASKPQIQSSIDRHDVIVVNFHSEARFNGKQTSACMVEYDSVRRRDLLSGYESFFMSRDDVLYYIAAHEFGHCMADHQATFGKAKHLDSYAHELLADRVAITFFMINGREKSAARIVEFNHQMEPGSIHHHPQELASFQSVLKERSAEFSIQNVKSMFDVYKIAAE